MSNSTLKFQKQRFNLLNLDHNEQLFNTCDVYINQNNKKEILTGKLHVCSKSIIIDPDNLNMELIKIFYNRNFIIQKYSWDELSKYYTDSEKIFQPIYMASKQSIIPSVNSNRNNSINNSWVKSSKEYRKSNSYYNKYASTSLLIPNNAMNSTTSIYGKTLLNNLNNNNGNNSNNFGSSDAPFKHWLYNAISQVQVQTKGSNGNIDITKTTVYPYIKELCDFFDNSEIKIAKMLQLFSSIYHINKKSNSSNKAKYYTVLLVKYNTFAKFNRINFTEAKFEEKTYEKNKNYKGYLIVCEDIVSSLNTFMNDWTIFTETMCKCIQIGNDNDIVSKVTTRKINELQSNYTSLSSNDTITVLNSSGNNIPKVSVTVYATVMRINAEKNKNGWFIIHLLDKNKNDYLCEFIPVNNSISKNSFKFYLSDIKVFLCFRFLYRYKAISWYFYSHCHKNGAVFDFQEQDDFSFIYDFFTKNCKKRDMTFEDITYHTNLWVNGWMSNYDYIDYLNILSSRSYNDVSQYPIFPWTLINFKDKTIDLSKEENYRDLSKPIGALNPIRLKTYKEKYYEDMCFYSNYISYPKIIFYYWIRTHPMFYLRFHDGNLGPPDRMFYSLQECWNVTYTGLGQELKELIPEFYCTENGGAFLKNIHNMNYGNTQGGLNVNNVILPPWADSPQDFINTMRSALESDIVSNKLHLWIDLIFGYKQKGTSAYDAANWYSNLRYENAFFELGDKDEEMILSQIRECGQAPIQWFTEPHPKRKRKNWNSLINLGNTSDIKLRKQAIKTTMIENTFEQMRLEEEKKTIQLKQIIKDKSRYYTELIIELNDTSKRKEKEFKEYSTSLLKIINENKKQFNLYQENKEKILKDWIITISKEHKEEIHKKFDNDKIWFTHLKGLEKKLKYYQDRAKEFKKILLHLHDKHKEIENDNKKQLEYKSERGDLIRSYPIEIKNQVLGSIWFN